METVRFITPEDQARGLLRYPAVPRGVLFVFPNITSKVLTTIGLSEPIRVVFLDAANTPIRIGSGLEFAVQPGNNVGIPPQTRHVLEASIDTPILRP